jgi:hypothetical protein
LLNNRAKDVREFTTSSDLVDIKAFYRNNFEVIFGFIRSKGATLAIEDISNLGVITLVAGKNLLEEII